MKNSVLQLIDATSVAKLVAKFASVAITLVSPEEPVSDSGRMSLKEETARLMSWLTPRASGQSTDPTSISIAAKQPCAPSGPG